MRTLSIGRMVNTDKGIVAANQDSVAASLDHLSQALDARVELGPGMVLARGAGSWPVVAVSYFLIHADDAVDCSKAQALAEWLYCTSPPSSSLSTLASPATDALTIHTGSQSSTAASDIATRYFKLS